MPGRIVAPAQASLPDGSLSCWSVDSIKQTEKSHLKNLFKPDFPVNRNNCLKQAKLQVYFVPQLY